MLALIFVILAAVLVVHVRLAAVRRDVRDERDWAEAAPHWAKLNPEGAAAQWLADQKAVRS